MSVFWITLGSVLAVMTAGWLLLVFEMLAERSRQTTRSA
jgi:hypothetical protein